MISRITSNLRLALPLATFALALITSQAFADFKVRLMQANLTSGSTPTYNERHGARIIQGLKPDIVTLQEFNVGNNSEATLRHFVRKNIGEDYFFYRDPNPDNKLPNAILSRLPILEGGTWIDPFVLHRGFTWVRIQLPNGKILRVISVHFTSHSEHNRAAEALALMHYLHENVPLTEGLILGGDLNTGKEQELALKNLLPWFTVETRPTDVTGTTWGTNLSHRKILDWMLIDRRLAKLRASVIIGEGKDELNFPNGLVFDSWRYPRLEEVWPIRPNDSRARGMEHLAVISDLVFPDVMPAAADGPFPQPPEFVDFSGRGWPDNLQGERPAVTSPVARQQKGRSDCAEHWAQIAKEIEKTPVGP